MNTTCVVVSHYQNLEKIRKLIQLESAKSHLTSMDTIINIHDMKNDSSHRDLSQAIGIPYNKLFSLKSNTFGKFLLAITITNNRVIYWDTTTLSIVGGRVSSDIATEAGVWTRTKFFSAVRKAGKISKGLQRAAEPIEMMQWPKNFVDSAVKAAVLTVSVVFPPAAPVTMVVGFVILIVNQVTNAFFKTGNELARTHFEIS
ncbi:unnamed protein product [Orchesella dallaii]|uniref:Uncharacterized protein n=1 Tax=Orchesella dallaii TaxID=48710 RepID=A0ABP1QNS4_9HEXA